MKILLEVFADLWNFATFGLFRNSGTTKNKKPLPEAVEEPEEEIVREIRRQPFAASTEKAKVIDVDLVQVSQDGYVCAESARVFLRSAWSFDGAFMTLTFGHKVQVIRYEGRFVQVRVGDTAGWILKDEITTNYADIFPIFHKDIVYLYEHTEAKKLRQLTKDEFFAIELRMPLQAVEFASYILRQDGRPISWSNERPRLAGNWQNLLKGHLGIHIGIEPRTGSIMEYQYRDGTGHVGYVKEVHADETIVFLSVGREVDGKYTEELFTKTKWQEYRPVFIQVV